MYRLVPIFIILGWMIMGINEWTVIVAAIVVLVGSVWNLIASSKQTKDLDDNSKERHSSRKTEHDSLSKEHTGLSKEHTGLSKDISGVKDDLIKVESIAGYLRDEAKKAETLKQVLPKQELNLSEMLNHMTAIIEDNAKLREENKQLKLELERTKEHIHTSAMRNNNPEYNSERDDELELE